MHDRIINNAENVCGRKMNDKVPSSLTSVSTECLFEGIYSTLFFNIKYLSLVFNTITGLKKLLLRFRKAGRVWCGGARETH